jgi:phospholipid/cholesterol/gamma-HCH transport system permease protein
MAGTFFGWLQRRRLALRFGAYVIAAALSRATYTPATRDVTLKQIYFTAWQILPLFLLFAVLLEFTLIHIIVAASREFGIARYALDLVLRGLVLEVIPLLTALFVALRSGAAIATEVALMRVTGELEAIEGAGDEPLRVEFVPRVAATMISVLALTILSNALALVIAYGAMYGLTPWGFGEFTRVFGRIFGAASMLGFTVKCLLFGAAVAVVPIAAGLEATARIKSAPVAVLGGMVRLFFVLGVIEVVALAARYI